MTKMVVILKICVEAVIITTVHNLRSMLESRHRFTRRIPITRELGPILTLAESKLSTARM